MDAADFLDLSKWLLRNPLEPREASLRTATSRAYLASALTLMALLRARFAIEVPRTCRFYQAVEERSKEIDPYFCRSIKLLRELRNRADYELDSEFSEREASKAVVMAQEIAARLSEKL